MCMIYYETTMSRNGRITKQPRRILSKVGPVRICSQIVSRFDLRLIRVSIMKTQLVFEREVSTFMDFDIIYEKPSYVKTSIQHKWIHLS